MKFLVVDSRIQSLQNEAYLPNSYQMQIGNESNRESLESETEKLAFCKEVYTLCIVGLKPLSTRFA